MAGTREGSLKAARTNKQRYGSDFFSIIGRAGGVARGPNTHKKGWGSDPEAAAAAGRIGGPKGKRKPVIKEGW